MAPARVISEALCLRLSDVEAVLVALALAGAVLAGRRQRQTYGFSAALLKPEIFLGPSVVFR